MSVTSTSFSCIYYLCYLQAFLPNSFSSLFKCTISYTQYSQSPFISSHHLLSIHLVFHKQTTLIFLLTFVYTNFLSLPVSLTLSLFHNRLLYVELFPILAHLSSHWNGLVHHVVFYGSLVNLLCLTYHSTMRCKMSR